MLALQIIFWLSLLSLAHTYIFYPLFLKIAAIFTATPSVIAGESQPAVSILIAAYNEEKVIKEKLESIFNSDYPADKIEVLVGSDASTDQTNKIIKTFPQVQLINFEGRSGKVKIINHLKSLAKHDVLILTDANVLFDKNTLTELLKHFSNPEIGLVDSHMQHIKQKSMGVSKAENTYIRGEVGIKYNEGKVFGKMMGPFGGCYAVRKSLYENVPENFLVDDFYINMKVLKKGSKAISEIKALVFEEVPSDWKIEFKRKVRIATGSFQNLKAFSHLLFRFDSLSFCFLSHKVLRWKGPFLMISLYLSNSIISWWILVGDAIQGLLIGESHHMHLHAFQAFFILQNLLIVLFIFDLLLSALKIHFPPTRLISHFFTTNLALFIGFFKFLGGVKSSIWQPTARK